MAEVAHRCPCGEPDVLRTEPRLPDGTPFPTTYYATCPRLTGAVSTLETGGVMREMTERLAQDEALAAAYARAHEHYLAQRAELGEVPEIDGISAGGMPTRVKCLHVLVGTRSQPGRASTRSVTRRSRCSTTGGAHLVRRPARRRGRGRAEGAADE